MGNRVNKDTLARWLIILSGLLVLAVLFAAGARAIFRPPEEAEPFTGEIQSPTGVLPPSVLESPTPEAGFIPGASETTPTPQPTGAPVPDATALIPQTPVVEWVQDAHDAQRSGYTPQEPRLPWKLLWTWNGPDEQGGPGGHFYDAPREARTVTGGRFIYVPAGEAGLFALSKLDGSIAWRLDSATFNAAPAYDPSTGLVYAGSADRSLYQIDAEVGTVRGTYEAGSPLNKAALLNGPFVYALTANGELHKVHTLDMTPHWVYAAGSESATPPALSPAAGVVVFAASDLSIHAVNDTDGSLRWNVRPGEHPQRPPFTFEGYWPVIAEQQGVVFVRLNLGMDGLWSGPGENRKYPNTNAEIRAYLRENTHLKNLFALDLNDGSERFIPAVGYGGVETLVNEDVPGLDAGPVPLIKLFADGVEVAYTFFRSGQTKHPDGRWDSHIGEMVLNDGAIEGLSAGDLRFVYFGNSNIHITDEQSPLTMAGDTLFHAHWGASESARIVDRSPQRGLAFDKPILSEANPVVIRRMEACADYNPQTHWTTCGLTLFDDGRYWNGPGWWVYWNTLDPPTPSRRAYSEGILPRYTYASDGLVIVQGNGGDLMVFQHSGQE